MHTISDEDVALERGGVRVANSFNCTPAFVDKRLADALVSSSCCPETLFYCDQIRTVALPLPLPGEQSKRRLQTRLPC